MFKTMDRNLNLFALVVSFLVAVVSGDIFERIVGGAYIPIESAPYQVSLIVLKPSIKKLDVCGGSIINERFILTAQHCLVGLKSLDQIILRAGSSILDRGGVRVPVHRIIKHPKFDAALLELTSPLVFSENVRPIKLPKVGEKLPEQKMCLTTGWGLIKENEQIKSLKDRQLAGVLLRIIGHSQCQRFYHKQLRGHEICAGRDSGGIDACTADSGGPLTCQTSPSIDDRTLFGIVALGVGCARPKSPGVYVNVLEIRQWIQQVALV